MKVILSVVLTATVGAQDKVVTIPWPDFRGPFLNGYVEDALPLQWTEKQNVTWKTEIVGQGWSSPVIGENRVWLTTATERGRKLYVIAVDLQSGETLHQRVVFEVQEPQPKNALNSFASPSPVVEAGHVYIHFGSEGTACLDVKTAKTIW